MPLICFQPGFNLLAFYCFELIVDLCFVAHYLCLIKRFLKKKIYAFRKEETFL